MTPTRRVVAKCTKCRAFKYDDGSGGIRVFIPMSREVPLSTKTDLHEHQWRPISKKD